MRHHHSHLTAFLLLACLLSQAAFPAPVRAYSDLTVSDDCVELIERYEGFSATMYEDSGRWYIGYGSQVAQGAYPDGITEEEATALVHEELRDTEEAINSFCARNNLSLTQGQFDALADFTYTLGTSWLSGSSLLLRIVRGETEATRRETARAFGVWSHAGGVVLPGLAERRLEEAALYLDGDFSKADEFCYLAIAKEGGVQYATDFAVYERGGVYDAFPTMFRLGYALSGVQTADGSTIRLGDTVSGNRSGTAVWAKNQYVKRTFSDVQSEQWFYDYVMELSEADVIGGRGDGTYTPDWPTTTGEALKLVLLAAGHPEQAASGAHWASGYADYARERGYLPDAPLTGLDRPISRLQVARLAAMAMGFGQDFSVSPFADVDDGYVTALADVGILTGMTAHGEEVYYPDESLTRAQVSTIVWRVRNAVALGTRQTVYYGTRELTVAQNVALNRYDRNGFSGSGKEMTYTEPGVTVLRGIDVSRWNGDIDWQAAAADGIQFAILRVGGRYQQSGEIYDDRLFEEYYAGAKAAGLRIGVYFYSQAITTAEAVEEADYVLQKLAGRDIDGPVVFDWETAGISDARTNGLPVSVVCDCAVAYCERVKAAGYAPMVYMNTYDGYIKYDVSRLTDYDVWYAGQYNGDYPKFIYDFAMWQYTSDGTVNGIDGGTDMDLWFFRD